MRDNRLLTQPIFSAICTGFMTWFLFLSVERHQVGWTIFNVVFLVLNAFSAVDGFKKYLNSYHNPDA